MGNAPAFLSPANIVFPPDAGVIDVTKPPYNAKGDGRADDTASIQQALTDFPAQHAVIYLPNGTYLVSDTLRWGVSYPVLVRRTRNGQPSDVLLPDQAPGGASGGLIPLFSTE